MNVLRRISEQAKFLFVCLLLAGCDTGQSQSRQSDVFVERAIVAACEDLITEYAIARDLPDADRYAATFSENGELVLRGSTFQGRQAIRERIIQSAAKTRSMHFMGTTQIKVISPSEAKGISYATIYVEPRDGDSDAPLSTDGPVAIGAYHDDFVLTERGWKIGRRELKWVFDWKKD